MGSVETKLDHPDHSEAFRALTPASSTSTCCDQLTVQGSFKEDFVPAPFSGSSAFCKTSLNIWNFTVHILLKPGLENFEHYFTSV